MPDAIDIHVGGRIRQRRIMIRMSQSTLAENLGLTFQQVQKYEKGANRVGASRLQHIADIMNVPVSFFFEGGAHPSERNETASAPPDIFTSKEILSLVAAFSAIEDQKVRQRILALVRSIQNNGQFANENTSDHREIGDQ